MLGRNLQIPFTRYNWIRIS